MPPSPDVLQQRLRSSLVRLKASALQVPDVARSPERLRAWLRGARRAQISLAASLLFGLLLLGPVTELLADTIHPPRRRSRVFGGSTSRRQRDAIEIQETLEAVYWVGATGTVLWLLLLDLPAAAAAVAPRRENAGGFGAPQQAPPAIVPPPEPPQKPSTDGMATSQTLFAEEAMANTLLPSPEPGADATMAVSDPANAGASSDAGVGGQVGRYNLVRELGRGAMGVVYEGHDPSLNRTVAMKQLPATMHANDQLTARFRREAQALARLTHGGIVQVFDIVEGAEGMWIVMELVTGGSVMDRLESSGALPVAEAAELGRQMAEAMAYAHAQGIVHRDFKPDNVLLTTDGEVKITDFGLAKMAADGPKLTHTGMVLGSPAYMSPEQATGEEADERSDIYALGATLYELLTKRPPFEGESTASVLMQHITQTPRPSAEHVDGVPPEFDALLLRMLEKERDARPASMSEVAAALEGILRELPS